MSGLFDWDEANIAHIAKHGVTPEEAEEAVTSSPIDLQYQVRNGELRVVQIGETLRGKLLMVVRLSVERRPALSPQPPRSANIGSAICK
jgi:uncharacterized DUF497 family protein